MPLQTEGSYEMEAPARDLVIALASWDSRDASRPGRSGGSGSGER